MPPTGTGGPTPDCAGTNDGATTGTIVFRTVIQDEFSDTFPSGDRSVDQGDTQSDSVTVSGNVLAVSDLAPTGQTEEDGSGAGVTIARGSVTKSLYAINGVEGPPAQVAPGDTVTYRIAYDMPASDVEDLHFHDYLPLPVFDVLDPDAVGGAGPAWSYNGAAPGGVSYVFGPKLELGLGLAGFYNLAEATVFPYPILRIKISDRIRVSNPFRTSPAGPAGVEFSYVLNDRWEAGFGWAYRSPRFRLDYNGPIPNGIGEYRNFPIFLRLSYKVLPAVRIDGYGGASFFNKIYINDREGNELYRTKQNVAPLIGASISGNF